MSTLFFSINHFLSIFLWIKGARWSMIMSSMSQGRWSLTTTTKIEIVLAFLASYMLTTLILLPDFSALGTYHRFYTLTLIIFDTLQFLQKINLIANIALSLMDFFLAIDTSLLFTFYAIEILHFLSIFFTDCIWGSTLACYKFIFSLFTQHECFQRQVRQLIFWQ